MVTRHTYASADHLRDYLAGTSYSSTWTADSNSIRRILESQSRRIDNYCRGGAFGPVTETRQYDIGVGTLLHSPQYSVYGGSGANLGNPEQLVPLIPLDGWLVSTTTVTSYSGTARTTSETLSEGYNNDFFLLPYNQSPKTALELTQETAKTFNSGQSTLHILGTWGYTNNTSPEKTTTGTIATTTETSWGVNDASGLSPAQTILVDSEQMYITGISSNTLTVERGVNGTTAATHSASTSVYIYDYPELVAQACLDLAKITFRNRDLGVVDTLGVSEQNITVASKELFNVLATLDGYREGATTNSVIF